MVFVVRDIELHHGIHIDIAEILKLSDRPSCWRHPLTPGGRQRANKRVKTPPIITPPLNSPSVLISFEKMKFWQGHFSRET